LITPLYRSITPVPPDNNRKRTGDLPKVGVLEPQAAKQECRAHAHWVIENTICKQWIERTQKSPARFPGQAQLVSFNFTNKLICGIASSDCGFRRSVG
jgi:hypothetical protein